MREQLSAQPGTQRDAQPDESAPQRVLVLVVPDWPALAAALEADAPPTAPVAVLHANRVVSVNAPARALGVEPAMTTRAARGRCPDLFLAPRNPDAEARLFAAATQALDDTVARFTVLGPGAVSIPAASLRHTHPDEAAAVEHLLAALTESTGWEFLPGIADTHFAALLAARTATRVAPGSTRAFLAAQPTRAFDAALLLDETLDPQALSELVSVLERLGLRTLGAFAQLSPTDVSADCATTAARTTSSSRRPWSRPPRAPTSSRSAPAPPPHSSSTRSAGAPSPAPR
jgi:protein ImuB